LRDQTKVDPVIPKQSQHEKTNPGEDLEADNDQLEDNRDIFHRILSSELSSRTSSPFHAIAESMAREIWGLSIMKSWLADSFLEQPTDVR
jgi:hypothetical protein